MRASRPIPTPRRLGAAVLVLAAALACATTPEERDPSPQELLQSVADFHRHLRWGRYREASAFLTTAEREVFLGQIDELGDRWRVVEYEVKSIDIEGDGKRASSRVELQWTQDAEVLVRKDRIDETWEIQQGRWVIVAREVKALR